MKLKKSLTCRREYKEPDRDGAQRRLLLYTTPDPPWGRRVEAAGGRSLYIQADNPKQSRSETWNTHGETKFKVYSAD